jgi:hypothetical protein
LKRKINNFIKVFNNLTNHIFEYYNNKILKMASRINFWVLRQNYGEITNQTDMKKMIRSQQIVTCPWGGWGIPRQNVVDGIYNENKADISRRPSGGQDRKFVEEMRVGDIVLIPFKGKKECIIARIASDVEYAINTGLYWKECQDDGKIRISDVEEGTPFRPVGRRIVINNEKYIPKSAPNRNTLSKMKKMKNDVILSLGL